MTTDNTDSDGVWRDEERLPLSELTQAVATSSSDGQVDDLTGNDAGIEPPPAGPAAVEEAAVRDDTAEGDPEPTSAAGRSLRPDFTGPTGPA